MSRETWTIGKLLKWTEKFFADKGISSPRLDAEVLLADVLKRERIYLYVHFDEPLEDSELALFREYVKKRTARIPVSQILGRKEFMGHSFKVTENTLTPRPDTEILVQSVLERSRLSAYDDFLFADIGTGTGAISLSVLLDMSNARAFAVDISEAALAVAKENAKGLNVSDRIKFFCGDLLEPLKAECKMNAIVSNPPYISEDDYKTLEAEVREHEPRIALCGGIDGMDYYRRLIDEGYHFLMQGGFLAVETGIHQADKVAEMARENPAWDKIEIIKDYAGIDRVVVIWKAL